MSMEEICPNGENAALTSAWAAMRTNQSFLNAFGTAINHSPQWGHSSDFPPTSERKALAATVLVVAAVVVWAAGSSSISACTIWVALMAGLGYFLPLAGSKGCICHWVYLLNSSSSEHCRVGRVQQSHTLPQSSLHVNYFSHNKSQRRKLAQRQQKRKRTDMERKRTQKGSRKQHMKEMKLSKQCMNHAWTQGKWLEWALWS